MPTLMIRAHAKDDAVAEVEAAGRAVFAALDREKPSGLTYLSFRQQDGVYVIVLHLEDGVENPLPQFEEFRVFQQGLQQWLVEPAATQPLQVIGAYGSS